MKQAGGKKKNNLNVCQLVVCFARHWPCACLCVSHFLSLLLCESCFVDVQEHRKRRVGGLVSDGGYPLQAELCAVAASGPLAVLWSC